MPLLLLIMILCFSSPSRADEREGIPLPPDGYTVLALSATETQTMAQDLLIASLRIEAEGETPETVQAKVNAAMQKAVDSAKKEADVKTTTGGYYVYKHEPNPYPPVPVDKDGKPVPVQWPVPVWKASQTIDLRSKNAARLLDLAGQIQGMGFVMNNLSYTLSPEKAEEARDLLMVNALKKLRERAGLAAKTLGKGGYDLVDVTVDGGGVAYPMHKAMMMRGDMAMAEAMPAPVAEAGETDVSLTVSARALLKP